jgi:DNA-binding transcriptional LysR family regulator
MEIKQLEGLIAVAREGSFSRAAERLNLSQPSLSARIQQLEQSLGGKLLVNRRARPVTLTPVGETLLVYAERAVGILEAARQAVEASSSGTVGRLTITTPFSIATYLLPSVVNYFSNAYPSVELHIEAGHSDFAVSQLLDGISDLAFTAAFPQYIRQTKTIHRFHDKMGVAVSKSHPLAVLKKVPVEEVMTYRLLLIHWGQAFESYVESLREMHPNSGQIISVPLASALPMVQESDTICFMPRRLIIAAGLVEVDVPDILFDWDVVLVARPGHLLTPLETEFVNIVNDRWKRLAEK